MSEIRTLCLPYLLPSDLIRVEIDEIWPAGASILHINKKSMFFGIIRFWPAGFEALPHQDLLSREISNHLEGGNRQISQLGFNIYLKTADLGGELELWDYSFSEQECLDQGIRGSYGFTRNLLPDKSYMISPQRGDLILINTAKVHSVNKVLKGERLTVSGFIGCWGADHPLKFWS